MRRSAAYQQQCTPDRIVAFLRALTNSCTADEIAFALGVSRQDVQNQIGPMVLAKRVERHHISDGTLRYSLLREAAIAIRQRRDGESINDTILHCLRDASEPLLTSEIHARTGIDKATIYARLPLLINDGRVVRGGTQRNLNFRLATPEESAHLRATMVSVDVHLDVVLDEIKAIATHPDAHARTSALFVIKAEIEQSLAETELGTPRAQRSAATC
jgi:hypothetical protein